MTTTLHDSKNKTGIIFIHGAGLGGWIWNDVVSSVSAPCLIADYSPLERTNSVATLADYVDAVMNQIDDSNIDRVVVVAHSAGGVVGIELAKRLGDRLAGFVGVAASIPKPGTSFVSTLPFPQKLIMPIILKLAGTKPPESAIRAGLTNGLSTAQSDRVVAEFQQESSHLYTDKVSDGTIADVPTRYIKTANDKEFTAQMQDASIANLPNCAVIDVASGHMPMVSDAGIVAECVEGILKTYES